MTGDEPTIIEIYDRHFDYVWRSLRRLGVFAGDLEDATQDVFVIVHRRLALFEGRSTLKSWLFGIALRVAKVYRRNSARERERIHEDETVLVCKQGNPEQTRESTQAAEQLQALLQELDDEKRAVFIMAELEQLTAAEIAQAANIPINTVYSRLRLARAAFEDGVRRLRAKNEWRFRCES